MKTDRSIEKTIEDYLEAMLIIKEEKGYVRSIDVAHFLDVTKPSVTYTTKRLKERGYITMNEDNLIFLTDDGRAIAEKTYIKHKALSDFFIRLGVDEKIAVEDACRIEHDISPETFDALCSHICSVFDDTKQ